MRTASSLLSLFVLLVIASSILACGLGRPRMLQSVSISPTTASSQGQFTATGTYTDGSKVTPLPVVWFPIMPWYNQLNQVRWINLDATGKASCNGNPGSFSVIATAPVDPHVSLTQMNSLTLQMWGTAQLTCP